VSTLADYRHPPRIRRLLASIAPIACPPEIEPLGLVTPVVDHTELTLRSFPEVVRSALLAGLTSYELTSAMWPGHRGRPASRLDRERATRYYRAWRRSPLRLQRELVKGVKGILCLAYYEMPQVKEQLGYAPEDWIRTATRHRLERHGEAIARHRAALFEREPLLPLASTDNPERGRSGDRK